MSTTFAKATQKKKKNTLTHTHINAIILESTIMNRIFLKTIAKDRDDKNVYDNISMLQFELNFTVHCI